MKSVTPIKEGLKNVLLSDDQTSTYIEESIVAYKGVYNRVIKRIIDLCLSVILFVILLPLFLVISLTIAIDSGFPVLYCADRGGYKNRTFKMCKFRTMVKNADKIGGPTTGLNDPRITKLGAFLRKTKLDEIAQLLNIVVGQMSFVGPRPEALQYVERFEGVEKLILQVRPGITDYSSLKFINLDEIVGSQNVDEIFETVVLKQKNILRVKYVATVSLKTDVWLFFETVRRVIRKFLRVILRKFSSKGNTVDVNSQEE